MAASFRLKNFFLYAFFITWIEGVRYYFEDGQKPRPDLALGNKTRLEMEIKIVLIRLG
ncbi:hypothetical protein FQN54_007067 [Arachnomyces sp. PD_36]|nr:hypothetical protein FQN54_007067 [Arachnomyces sp. PD_36]